jgi:hypothetical protein
MYPKAAFDADTNRSWVYEVSDAVVGHDAD